MPLKIVYQSYTLRFRKEAGTSRGVLTQKTSWILKITDSDKPGTVAYGECGPLPGLSVDDVPDFEDKLAAVCHLFNELDLEVFPFNICIILDQVVPQNLPSIRFGVEMALMDMMNGGNRIIFKNAFSAGQQGIVMNGLIWMGSYDNMLEQVSDKLALGFTTLKMKVGAIDFEQECRILARIRERFDKTEITLRVDANGAFTKENVNAKLEELSRFDLHSIEQPIKAGQHELMAKICASSPIPVALDEELIGHSDYRDKFALLKKLAPSFIVLKPSLLGGFRHSNEWIEIANRLKIDWWITSALESNIGLNAIAQYTASKNNPLPQGLGTGQLYTNNFDSPMMVEKGELFYDMGAKWELPM